MQCSAVQCNQQKKSGAFVTTQRNCLLTQNPLHSKVKCLKCIVYCSQCSVYTVQFIPVYSLQSTMCRVYSELNELRVLVRGEEGDGWRNILHSSKLRSYSNAHSEACSISSCAPVLQLQGQTLKGRGKLMAKVYHQLSLFVSH